MTDFGHGSRSKFKLDNSSGTLTDISDLLMRVMIDTDGDTIDVTTIGAKWNDYQAIARDATITLEGHFDLTVNTIFGSVFSNLGTVGQIAERSWEFAPRGQVSGQPQILGEGLLTRWTVTAAIDEPAGWKAVILIPRGITVGVYA